jgi:pilus assembly protein Flp/PilA
MLTCLTNFVRREEGATMVEYGLMLAFIALVCVAAVAVIGAISNAQFIDVIPGLK